MAGTFSDPLNINLARQTRLCLSQIPLSSLYRECLEQCSSPDALLNTLSRLLAVPSLTLLLASSFRPLLLDLLARWLDDDEDTEDRFVALCLLVDIHEEIFPVLSEFLRRPSLVNGPLAFVDSMSSPKNLSAARLQRLLLSYYRLLRANRFLPRDFFWPLTPLSRLFWTPHPDTGVRLLSIRCYALQTGMSESEREELQKQVLGPTCVTDCNVEYGQSVDGKSMMVDGWVMPLLEFKRIYSARNAIVQTRCDYYTDDGRDVLSTLKPSDLSPRIAHIYGVLLLRSSSPPSITSTLVSTPSAIDSLRALAIQLSLQRPTLLTSAPSCGKTLLLSHLAACLHPDVQNQVVTIHMADTSLEPRALLGSYVSSSTDAGAFEWRDGVLVRAMHEGKWVVLDDIDRGSNEVLGLILPLVESIGPGKPIGGRAALQVPSRGRVEAHKNFALFATRSQTPSRNGNFSTPTFFGAHKFYEITMHIPTNAELRMIIDSRFPRLAGSTASALISLWESVRVLGSIASTREIGIRELEKYCSRVEVLLSTAHPVMDLELTTEAPFLLPALFPNTTLREDMYLEARDVFFGAGAPTAAARVHLDSVAAVIAEHLGLTPERRDWVLKGRVAEFQVEMDLDGRTIALRIDHIRIPARIDSARLIPAVHRPFSMHKPAITLLSRISKAISLQEPVLLTGETGTGKTSIITHMASLLNRPLISLNLSHQTESSDLLGGLKPVDMRVPGSELQGRFLDLFAQTFSRRKNAKFEASVRKVVSEGRWKRVVGLWKDSARLARDRFRAQELDVEPTVHDMLDSQAARKRRKLESMKTNETAWDLFERDVQTFEAQYLQGKGKLPFSFVEGPLVKALRSGDWVLLDEINLATSETLECLSDLLQGPMASITLTEHGSLEPVLRHPEFRVFACMNPATDVGKKDLPPNIRSRFTEINVPALDADRETLLSIVTKYIGACAVGDKAAILDVAEFYVAVKQLADKRQIADGSNRRPHYSMRTLARALTFAADVAGSFGLRRSLWEGCTMAFTMVLDAPSAELVTHLGKKYLLAAVRNPQSLLSQEPSAPRSQSEDDYVKLGPFFLQKGNLPVEAEDNYVITPSVEKKLLDIARIVLTGRFPVLIEGPTSSGKTSSIEYLARRTGHRFVRINNHEHTDIQEYLGTYVSDDVSGRLVYKDGLLVRALRNGDWIVLDELNLAPTDVLEALNRLLDDNRELVIPETQEVIRPHPHFMLFATQNPPGLYAGRKVLSRAFRNRFLEVHFEDVPEDELETILCQRCCIAPSYGQRIVTVFRELQKRRQSSRVFESKQGFATLRDLFRWAGRDAVGYQELAENGFMLLAERARREDDRAVVKEVLESVMKVQIDEVALYNLHSSKKDFVAFLGCPIPSSSQLVWTYAMRRLFVLVCRALRFNEPVLLVGETGTGKTSVCQVYAEAVSKRLYAVNCHQNTETADFLGGQRPVRNKASTESELVRDTITALNQLGFTDLLPDARALKKSVDQLLKSSSLSSLDSQLLIDLQQKLERSAALFEWHDGPLVQAMRDGEVLLLDEISLADDSVLERLNSVLEADRTLVLAEKGGNDSSHPSITASAGFQIVATMNPGGDFGKKELSPALRNRFTEIWVPSIDNKADLELIVRSSWRHDALKPYTSRVLDFAEWLSVQLGDRSPLSLRDLLTWVMFSNSVCQRTTLTVDVTFHHAAHTTYIDSLGSLPQTASYSRDALKELEMAAMAKLQDLVPVVAEHISSRTLHESGNAVHIGHFAIPKGAHDTHTDAFNIQAPTSWDNAVRVVRACQIIKPILLEGSPGVGKTSLIAALANVTGNLLHRINLSDQTDLVDLFGTDLPVEGGKAGEFVWKDAEFLHAMQEGHWVLLDEMNLAPQAVLEGLNAVLDHRGTVYVPELGRSFTRHSNFRVFAAQNPLHQGGGRKGLPKSFINRFTKVYVQELSTADQLVVCHHLFPDLPVSVLQQMIDFTFRLNEAVTVKRVFARQGGPWEFNLRDILRWATLLHGTEHQGHPIKYVDTIFLERFRSREDREHALILFEDVFKISRSHVQDAPHPFISASQVQIGQFHCFRSKFSGGLSGVSLLRSNLLALEAAGNCLSPGWLVILTGLPSSGKTNLVRLMAHLTENALHEITLNTATDTMDILGSFEQVNDRDRILGVFQRILTLMDRSLSLVGGTETSRCADYFSFRKSVSGSSSFTSLSGLLPTASRILEELSGAKRHSSLELQELQAILRQVSGEQESKGRFEWVDGPLVRAIKYGHWLLVDGANLCSPSILDRLNSLCENNGVLVLNERGHVNGEVAALRPHPNFRLFMTVDPRHGELSRAMRNRGVEIALLSPVSTQDAARILNNLRLPSLLPKGIHDMKSALSEFERLRRGLSTSVETGNTPEFILMSECDVEQEVALSDVLRYTLLLLDYPLLDAPRTAALLSCFVLTAVPSYILHLRRFLNAVVPTSQQHFVSVLLWLLDDFLSQPWFKNVEIMREKFSHALQISPALLPAQPLGFLLFSYCDPTKVGSGPVIFQDRWLVFDIVRLFVELRMRNHMATDAQQDQIMPATLAGPFQPVTPSISDERLRGYQEAHILLSSIQHTSEAVLSGLDVENAVESMRGLKVALTMLKYCDHLRNAASVVSFDYSWAQTIARWMIKVLENCPQSFDGVKTQALAFQESTAALSGIGLSDIWSTFLLERPSGPSLVFIARLESAIRHLADGPNAYRYRLNILDLLTSESQSSSRYGTDGEEFIEKAERLKKDIMEDEEVSNKDRQADDPSLLVMQMSFVSSLKCQISDKLIKSAESIVDLGCRAPQASLPRLVSYLQLVRRGTENVSVSMISSLQIQWLETMWESQSFQQPSLRGPAMFFCPILLSETIRICHDGDVTLLALESHEFAVTRYIELVLTHGSETRTRIHQATAIFVQAVLMILGCFPALGDETQRAIQLIWHDEFLGSEASLVELLQLFKRLQHSVVGLVIYRHLFPTVEHLSTQLGSRRDTIFNLGLCWIATARAILDLYVPDPPIDPLAARECAKQFWGQEESSVASQIDFYSRFERMQTGNDANELTRNLEAQLEVIQQQLSVFSTSLPSRGHDVSRVHAFWNEFSQFLEHVISPQKLEPIIVLLTSGQSDGNLREQMIQDSITGFLHRFRAAYTDFDDIKAPLELALLYVKFGLRVLAQSCRYSSNEDLVATAHAATPLVVFPTIKVVLELQSPAHVTALMGVTGSSSMSLQLACIAYEVAAGVDVSDRIQTIDSIYSQTLRLWLIDRAKEREHDLAAHSLYRRRCLDQDVATDGELEELEFLELFPTFETTSPETEFDTHSNAANPLSHAPHVDASHVQPLFALHQYLFLHAENFDDCDPLMIFQDLRRSTLKSLVESRLECLSEAMDDESLPYRYSLLRRRLSGFVKSPSPSSGSYSFYHDPNVQEIRKAASQLERFAKRLDNLVQEWPDQMVLQNLKTRCADILRMDSHSSVAKVLAAVEQLVQQIEDWENYANRENSLRSHQQVFIGLVVEWRRLELSCWQQLLRQQARDFASAASHWWFRLYEASVRGVIAAVDEDNHTPFDEYLSNLIPLIEDFISSSPIGQFEIRMRLLHSFGVYLDLLSSHTHEPQQLALKRAGTILHALHGYFDQFTARVASSLSRQKSDLERDIKALIKLASWKDVNVHALKQSAQRTHRQLYRSIRKFRDILRQSVTPFLQPGVASETERKRTVLNLPFTHSSTPHFEFPEVHANSGRASHLLDLPRVLRRFDTLIVVHVPFRTMSKACVLVDDIAVDIIETAQYLSSLTIPVDVPAPRREKSQKALHMRKRKAWNDLLKELKRVGFAANPKPDVLAKHNDKRWMAEQPRLVGGTLEREDFQKCESYFARLKGTLPLLRSSLSNHNVDFTFRELQRGVMLLESGFSLALQSRACLVRALQVYEAYQNVSRRLRMVISATYIVASGPDLLPHLAQMKYTAHYLVDAMNDILIELRNLRAQPSCPLSLSFPSSLLSDVQAQVDATKATCDRLCTVLVAVSYASYPLLLDNEHKVLTEAEHHLSHALELLNSWSQVNSNLSYLFRPVYEWLKKQRTTLPPLPSPMQEESRTADADRIINTLLVVVQGIISRCPEPSKAIPEERADRFIQEDGRLIQDITQLLDLQGVIAQLDHAVQALSATSTVIDRDNLRQFLPFLDRYTDLVDQQLTVHTQWCKTILKLDYVLCSVMHTVCTMGFCKPPDPQESDSNGDKTDALDGMGLGEGVGNENVSSQIEDESQVEGLKGDDEHDTEQKEDGGEENAIEMSEDFGGEMEDIPDADDQSDDEDGTDPQEELGKLNASDPAAVDEKLWGDENGPEPGSTDDNGIGKDRSKETSAESELVAKDGQRQRSDSDKEKQDGNQGSPKPESRVEEEPLEDVGDEDGKEDQSGANGAQLDEHVPDANTLDLPDDIDLGPSEDLQGDLSDDEDNMEGIEEPDDAPNAFEDDGLQSDQQAPIDPSAPMDVTQDAQEDVSHEEMTTQAEPDMQDADTQDEEQEAPSRADVRSGGEDSSAQAASKEMFDGDPGERDSTGQQGQSVVQTDGNSGPSSQSAPQSEKYVDPVEPPSRNESLDHNGEAPPSTATSSVRGPANAQSERNATTNGSRALGDATKEVRQHYEEILDGSESRETTGDAPETSQLEYLHPDDDSSDMQALGSTRGEEVAKLSELKIAEDHLSEGISTALMDIDSPSQTQQPMPHKLHQSDPTTLTREQDVEGALTEMQIRSHGQLRRDAEDVDSLYLSELQPPGEDQKGDDQLDVEAELRQWQSAGYPDSGADHVWRLYESLTHDLSFALCEQLRLILEPTMATRLKGDYRTGKRLNMKKIIPYIASEYTKDKIWLRRTKPSQREYQVLIALDDSRSMAESHSVHLAYETLALVSKALSRLEVGDIAIARFGEAVDVLHGFNGGPFTDQAGVAVMSAFKFNQKATDMLSLLQTSLKVLGDARELRTASSSSAELWQLEIIISDGICQDHDQLRTVLRKAEEQRVMIVFIIVDARHSATSSAEPSAPGTSGTLGTTQNSILSMNQVTYKNVDGRMEIQMDRYLDTFPFEYYVVLRNVEALPDVLSGTLKQFFERISEE